VTAVYFFYLIAAVAAYATRSFGARTAAFAALLTAATPRLSLSVLIVHIDPLRVYGFFLPFAFLMEFLRSGNKGWLIGSAIATAIGLHVHAGNLLLIPAILVLYFLLSRESLWHRLRTALLLGLLVGAISGTQYVNNLERYGSLTRTGWTLEAIPEFRAWEALYSETPFQALISALAPFTNFGDFGPTPWLGLVGLLLLAKNTRGRWRLTPEVSVIVLLVTMYFSMCLLAVPTGFEVFYKNPRYALIILPFMAIAGGFFCVHFMDWLCATSKFERLWYPHLAVSSVVLTLVVLLPSAIHVGEPWKSTGYVLSTLSAAALALGWASVGLAHRSKYPVLAHWVKTVAMAIFVIILSAIPFFYLRPVIEYNLRSEFWSVDRIARSDLEKVAGTNSARNYALNRTGIAEASREIVSPGQTVLNFNQYQIYYYGKAYSMSEYDNRLSSFYEAESLEKARQVLESLNIRYLYVPNSYTPGMAHPYFQQVLYDHTRISMAYQSGSTLLRYDSTPRAVELTSILDLNSSETLDLKRHHRWTHPRDLGKCDWFSTIAAENQSNSVACRTWYDSQNWIPIRNGGNTYKLTVDTTGTGCVNIIIYYRRKVGASWTMGATSLDFASTGSEGLATQYFRPPADTDGLALAFSQSCGIGPGISRVHLYELRESS
jgi:4-amino-4-deoxy-L-arabinose transferase-like glycosyltransferase